MSSTRANRSPALLVSALIHAGVIVAAVVAWPFFAKPIQLGKVVPVTIVTNAPPAEMSPAVQAPKPAPAMTPAPEPQAPAAPAPISPAPPAPPPKPAAPPKPAPQPKPTPAKQAPALKPAPAPAKANAAKQDLDLDALVASLSTSTHRASARASAGDPGPNRLRTDTTAQQGKGSDDKMSGSELGALTEKLGRLWNPNCQVEGAHGIIVRVHVRLTPQGYVVGQPELADGVNVNSISDPIQAAASRRALSAAGRAQPYSDVLKPEHYAVWKDMILKFDARNLCG
jgi:periplasmic protein TonB